MMKPVALKIYCFFISAICVYGVQGQPHPPSQIIRGIEWSEEVIKLHQGAGDNWPITWVNDTLQITSYGDGDGFDGTQRNLSLGMAYITGDPPGHHAIDFSSNIDTPEGGGPSGIKTSGIIMVDGILYLFVRNYKPPGSDDHTNARLAWSTDYGKTFQWADWYFSDTFGCPTFIQFGADYANAMDDYVYIASQDNDNAYQYAPDVVLARVPKDRIADRVVYEFYAGMDSQNQTMWSREIQRRAPIFTNPQGVQRIDLVYNPAIARFILTTSHRPAGDKRTHTDALGIFESAFPWGPWYTIFYDDDWSDNCRTYHHRFPTKWMSSNGREMWLLYSGLDCGLYDFCLVKARLKYRE